MKELVFKRQNELEEIYRGISFHLISFNGFAGNIDMSELLQGMDDQIKMAKKQALSRRDILDRVEKWKFADV